MEIPAEVQLRATIRAGSVYYFPEFFDRIPHFFIVMNIDPLTDTVIYLLCASSRIQKVYDRNTGSLTETLVEISPSDYEGFNSQSIVDCNEIHTKSLGDLIGKLEEGRLTMKPEMTESLLAKLRLGVFRSKRVPERIKGQICPEEEDA